MVRILVSEVESKITSEIFIKDILNKHFGIERKKLTIEKNKYGKPFLVNFPNIHYNVSHTKGLIVCAISDSCVGVDVERIKPFNTRIIENFFSRNERQYIFASKENQDERFFEIWTKKEAYVKWVGMGMDIPFELFDVFNVGHETIKIYSTFYLEYCISICVDVSL